MPCTVAPVMLRRVLRPVDIRGLAIPAGADVFVAPVLSHRLPVLFSDADRYDPDRYLANPKQTSYLHGFGEASIIATPAVIAGAVADALAPLGVEITSTRLHAHYLRQAIRAAGYTPDATAFASR